jgi:plasmid stabilization system protein ParE
MTRPVIVSEDAQKDFDEAVAWHERQQAGLGVEFIDNVNETLRRIETNPKAYAIRFKETRRAPVARFRYGVFFQIDTDAIVVTSIIHDRRDPSIWMQRS